MASSRDIIYAQPLDCYVEMVYDTKLRSVRFIKGVEGLKEVKISRASIELDQYFKGERTEFTCEMDISELSPFTWRVLNETGKIKFGETITYSELAKRIGSRGYRAVGRALAANPVPIVIPCHRVVGKRGTGGFSAGVDIKTRLLELEQKISPITFNRS
ncbi:MAG: methylated-DNA--[protein]-cysteine S-methyltransferase [Candidatus Methanoperedens sp.]|nr:methylated-DNA--[protein]-cysteine S-methyltransferase [Candidatus Methanoperedens sp.]